MNRRDFNRAIDGIKVEPQSPAATIAKPGYGEYRNPCIALKFRGQIELGVATSGWSLDSRCILWAVEGSWIVTKRNRNNSAARNAGNSNA